MKPTAPEFMSMYKLTTSQFFTSKGKQSRIYEAQDQGEKIGIYYEDFLIGWLEMPYRKKRQFTIESRNHGLDFKAVIKFSDITVYGEKLMGERLGHHKIVRAYHEVLKTQP